MTAAAPVLDIADLSVSFQTPERRRLKVLDGVTLHIDAGEVLGVVGESGSGKSVTALSVLRLLGEQGAIDQGRIALVGRELTQLPEAEMLKIRGRHAAMIFQEPMSSLNPVYTVGFQIMEVLVEHLGVSSDEARKRAIELMQRVGIPSAERRVDDYPHQLSGGMRQRVMIAIALACSPKLLIADEPTTALDVTIQAQILALMRKLRDETGAAILMITHDLGVIAQMADRVVVMYAGQVVEEGNVSELFARPLHPYTRLLMRSIPLARKKLKRLETIAGTTPSPASFPQGCRFNPRCPEATDRCQSEPQVLRRFADGRQARCWRAEA
jgi:oligopeptide/dipeptide ABC transporter ATP-binding protein